MARNAVHLHVLLAEQHVVADLQHRDGAVELRAEEVGEREIVVRAADEQRASLGEARHGLAGDVVERHQAAAVDTALEGVRVELAVDVVIRDAQQSGVLAEQLHPGVQLGRAVVAVHHRDEVPVRGRHDVDHLVGLGQFLLQDNHRDGGRAGGDVARTGTDGVRRNHAGACVAFRRAERDAGLQVAGDIQALRARLGQAAGQLAGAQHLRQDVAQLPGVLLRSNQFLELLHHVRAVISRRRIDREHAGGVADAQHLLPGQLPVDVAGERGQVADALHVGLAVQDGLIQVRDAPAERNVIVEELGELRGGGTGVGVAPGAERSQQVAFLVERHVAVHHRTDADGGEVLDLHAIALLHVGAHVGIALLEAKPDDLLAVSPQAVLELVLPLVAALGDRDVELVHQHRLDAGGAEFNAQYGFAAFDTLFRVHTT